MLLLLATIALLPLLLAGAWAVHSTIRQQRLEVERSALDLSRALATAVGTELDATIASLRTLSQSQALADNDLPAFYRVALRVKQANPSWQSVILTDTKGSVLFSTSRPYGDTAARIVDPDSLRETVDSRRPVVGSARVGSRGTLAFPVRVPVQRDADITYVLGAAVLPERILDILHQQKVSADSVVAVFDASGKRVARTKEHGSDAPSPSLAKLLAGGGAEGVGVTTTLEGAESVTAFTHVPGHNWTVAVGVPTTGIGSLLLRGPFYYFVGVLASLVVWVLAASWLSRRIAGAVDQLRERATGLVRDGNLLPQIQSPIREINEANAALVVLSRERAEVEAERQRLLASVNAALDTTRLALSQAEEASRAKDNFLAMLGHEMRNPLAPIVSALDLLDLRGDERSDKERVILRRQVSRLHRLVDDLLDVSRIVQGKLEVRKEHVDIRHVVFKAQESVRHAAEAGGTRLHTNLPEHPIPVDGDPGRLEQAITNLLSNALRFAPGGAICITGALDGEDAVLVVEDDGAGMEATTLEKLFQPFFQAPQSLARSHGGLGLGLTIVRTIVELHNGRIGVSSELGAGSRFEIRLPQSSGGRAQAEEAEDSGLLEGRRVLVVDDNVDAAELLAAGLRMAGHDVQTAYSGSDALTLMRTFRPEVAILDIGMPEMDGYQLAHAIRDQYPRWQGQLLALSGYGQAMDKDLARAAGFKQHFTKPVRLPQLNRVIAMLLNA
ncbi:hybrid sensor histidine kinase/response regulator [Noviherbaspirillum humi]|uniref:hybrid sensor histidine kinase/response regulator n=1 Tax=Noviherbaspirillum humi TaxID=1688639 RepID=UPI001595653F|nr:ATP-binding protein [Noviherbaspirillum humi]